MGNRDTAATPRHATETDPLLPGITVSAVGASPLPKPNDETFTNNTRCTWPWLYVVLLAMSAGAVSCVCEVLWAAPRIRLFESALCRQYYQLNKPAQALPIPEHMCKIDAVQDQLAAILGGQFFFDSIPAILFPIPFGLLADKYGRKWLLVTSSLAYTLSFLWTLLSVGVWDLPLPWVWFSSAFYVICGGPTVATYLITTVVADVVPPASRTTVFFYRYCTDLIAELAISPLTSYLMSRNIWIPLIGAVMCQALSTLVCCAVPETAPPTGISMTSGGEPIGSESAPHSSSSGHSPVNRDRILGENDVEDSDGKYEGPFSLLTSNRLFPILIGTFLASKIGRASSNILLQYVSKRYGWSLAQAGLLVSLRAAINITLFVVILPALAALLLRRFGIPAIRDLLLARGSALLSVLGTGVLAVSPTPALMITGLALLTLGAGYPHAARGLLTSIAETHSIDKSKSQIARLYAFVSVAEGLGSLVAALTLSWTFRIGMKLGTEWLGLPFGFTTVLYCLVAAIVFGVSTKCVS